MAKRLSGEGTVRQRPNGRWEVRLRYAGSGDGWSQARVVLRRDCEGGPCRDEEGRRAPE